MPLLIGILLALAVSVMGTLVGFDRDRSFYPTMTIVIASTYGLFAVMGGSANILPIELAAGMAFVAAAIVGFKADLRIVAVALCAHGLFDLVHGRWIANAGVPPWWPMFCLSYDVVAGGYLAVLLARTRIAARVTAR
jgi:hypothetical protein